MSEDDKCKCGQYDSLRHTLSNCELGLKRGRYTWRHDQLMRVIYKALKEKINSINARKLPQKEVFKEVKFHSEGGRCPNTMGAGMVKVRGKSWDEK